MGLSAMFALAANAQTTIKLKADRSGELKQVSAKGGPSATPYQITGGITCNTQYVAGTTMDLNFTVLLTNTDSEYGDLITITFPAGITPNTSASNTPTVGTGATYIEALNPIVGQAISWGDDDNNYGGIVPGTSYSLTVNVTIGAGVTGNQTASYDVSGDTYGAAPGDLTGGSMIIYPSGATVVDMKTKIAAVLTNTVTFETQLNQNCSMGTYLIVSQIHNLGTNTESNIPVNYSINGVPSVATTYTGSIAPGDSAIVLFPLPGNFSAQGIYNLKAWTAIAGDAALSNDTNSVNFTNTIPTALTSSNYTNGFETAYDQSSVNNDWLGLGLPFGLSATAHTGTRALFYTVPTSAPTGTYAAMINMPCVDVVNGETYRISYWRKTLSSPAANGMSGIFTGIGQNSTDMNVVLKAYSTITPTTAAGPWSKDSVDYVATATETRYFGIGGMGTVSASSQINVRIDDINITKVTGSVGIKTITNTDAIAIFPNPTSGILNINAIETNSSVEVFNVIGEKVYTNSLVKGSNSVDLSGLSNGAYFVKLNSNGNITTKKVVLSK